MAVALAPHYNPNLQNFATSVSSVSWVQYSYLRGTFAEPAQGVAGEWDQLLGLPPSFHEVSSVAGDTSGKRDHHPGRGGWFLANHFGLDVWGVHTPLWTTERGVFDSPLLRTLRGESRAIDWADSAIQSAAKRRWKPSSRHVSVIGGKGTEVFLCQVVADPKVGTRHLDREEGAIGRYGQFETPKLKSAEALLYLALRAIRDFAGVADVRSYILHIHPKRDDKFFLYRLVESESRHPRGFLKRRMVCGYHDYQTELEGNLSHFLEFKGRASGPYFGELPPCRGSRALQFLSLMAKQQWEASEFLTWSETELRDLHEQASGLCMTRNKGRHDLEDRVLRQAYADRIGGRYFVTVKGIATYLACLAKYTNCLANEPPGFPYRLINWCEEHHKRIVEASRIYLE